MNKEATALIEALNQVAEEKGIEPGIIFEALETSLVTACKRNYGNNIEFRVNLERATGKIECFSQKTVVEEVTDKHTQIKLEKAREINNAYEIGDTVETLVVLKDFGRIAAQTAKQVIVQKLREAERNIIYNEYVKKEKTISTAIVDRNARGNVIVSIGKVEAMLPIAEQIPGEKYEPSTRLKVFILDVKQGLKGVSINVSRVHPGLVRGLFLQEVPEIADGTVEIKNIAREAGARSKISVFALDDNVDAIGACVGPLGNRINMIVDELGGEKIDIINWDEDPHYYIEGALSPSDIVNVTIDEEQKMANVLVAKDQLSLAIGKEGQNVRLAARLTGYKIDIKAAQDSLPEEQYKDPIEDNDSRADYEAYYNEHEITQEDSF